MMRFARLSNPGRSRRVVFSYEGRPVEAEEGDTVATALLAAGVGATRTSAVSGAARGAYCMMGVCFDCLVMIDGAPNRQGCMTEIREGMRIERQDGARRIGG